MKLKTFADLSALAESIKARPHAPRRILISMGTCGLAAGAAPVRDALLKEIADAGMEKTFEVTEVGCMGLCFAEPTLMVLDNGGKSVITYGEVTPAQVQAILNTPEGVPALGVRTLYRTWYYPEVEKPGRDELQARIVLRNTGRLDPESIESYIGEGGYSALSKVRRHREAGHHLLWRKSGRNPAGERVQGLFPRGSGPGPGQQPDGVSRRRTAGGGS